jgi:outer membrane protein assembly factor BamB
MTVRGTRPRVSADSRLRWVLLVAGALSATAGLFADDWPEIRGSGRRGVWTETGILDRFPEGGLKVVWRAPVKNGYSGPAVAGGRVLLSDFVRSVGSRGVERIMAFDEQTGKLLWTQEWDVNYGSAGFENGPHATPTLDGDRAYALGATGVLVALNAGSGKILWRKDYVKDYGADLGQFGVSSAPVVDGDRVIALIGGPPDAKVVAFDKLTGKEIWRVGRVTSPVGASQPMIIEAGGARQLIVWDATAITSLNPVTGAIYWEQPFRGASEMNIAMAHNGSRLLVSTFYEGPLMLELDANRPAARVLWRGNSTSEISTDKLHAVITAPIIDGDYIYGICSYGQLRALDARTGERLWESQAVTVERARWASAQFVQHGDRVFITNDRGELILARLTPAGYQEISRTPLLKPTTNPRVRRTLGGVNWMAPAYANRRIYVRNDEELIAVSLAQADYSR